MIIKVKKSQVKSVFIFTLLTILLISMIYAVSTTLTTADNYVDDDGFLDLRATCEPTSENNYDGTTVWNITNATLWSNVDGTWKTNVTLHASGLLGNDTYLFNFTNNINQSAEGEYEWNVQCQEHNVSDNTIIKKSFAGNNTITVRYARPTVTTLSPEDQSYDLDGYNILINCSASSSSEWNLTSMSLMTNYGDNWLANETYDFADTSSGVAYGFTYASGDNASIADGTDLIFGCSVGQVKNISGLLVTSEKSSANRTLNIEYPPTITLNNPPNNNWSKNKRVNLSWLVSSIHGSNVAPFPCQIWTNDTGTWAVKTGTVNVVNNTYQDLYVDFLEKTALKWGAKCQDVNDGNVWNMSVNRTINIDATNPTITGISPATSGTYSDASVTITFTPTDTNINGYHIYFDDYTLTNFSNSSAVSGVSHSHTINVTLPEGNYNYSIVVNDSAGRVIQTDNLTIIVDTTKPGFLDNTTMNVSVEGYCDQRNFTWDTNELTNHSFYIDTDTEVTDGEAFHSGTLEYNHSIILDFNYNSERLYYFNITSCDEAGNCNTSAQRTFTTPARICQGWSQYAVYDSLINLSVIQNQSGADLVYFWNATNQNWVYYTAGLSSNGHVDVGRATDYQVVHLYENTNSTWFRNQTNDRTYNYNVSSTHNFISIPRLYNFGNLTYSFMNTSKDYPSYINNTYTNSSMYGPFNITYFAGYNNSVQDYVSHIFNFTWSNATFLEPCPTRDFPITCMETAWVASGFNVSWNGTAIYANWTI